MSEARHRRRPLGPTPRDELVIQLAITEKVDNNARHRRRRGRWRLGWRSATGLTGAGIAALALTGGLVSDAGSGLLVPGVAGAEPNGGGVRGSNTDHADHAANHTEVTSGVISEATPTFRHTPEEAQDGGGTSETSSVQAPATRSVIESSAPAHATPPPSSDNSASHLTHPRASGSICR
jgi:hypothetical protein